MDEIGIDRRSLLALIGRQIEEKTKQAVVIDNRPGANGIRQSTKRRLTPKYAAGWRSSACPMTSPLLPPARRKCEPSASTGPNTPGSQAFSRSELALISS